VVTLDLAAILEFLDTAVQAFLGFLDIAEAVFLDLVDFLEFLDTAVIRAAA